jgi:NAD(P)-dependent dehydrogenase (short-subunit alcohol dehydrogenase family)
VNYSIDQFETSKNGKMSIAKWTVENIPDLTGKVVVVTGGNSGLGYESVKAFSEKGAEVILTSRSTEKGETAKTDILKNNPGGKITVMELDLMDFASIKKFANSFKEKYDRLDILLNNAGIMTTPYFLTNDGLEAQNGTNHFGHYALTGQLMNLIVKTPGSRVVNVSSNGHKYGKMDFDNLLFENGRDYTPMKSYARSKLSNLLFTYELQRNFESANADSIAVAAHPGASRTNLGRFLEDKWWFKPLFALMVPFTQDQAQGALPQIRASVDPEVAGGAYYGPSGFGEMKGDPLLVKSNHASHDHGDAKKLWEASEKLTGITYEF